MQNFAINGGALNGDPEIWIDSASASVVLQSSGDGMRGIVLEGSVPVALASSLSLALMAKLEGASVVTLSCSGALTYGVSLVGASSVVLSASGSLVRWGMLEGAAPTVLDLNGDIAVVPAISATFTMVMVAGLDLQIATGRKIEGYLPVVLGAGLQGYDVKATPLCGSAIVEFAGIGQGNLLVASPPGSAAIALNSAGDGRLGAKLSIEGIASIGLYARGYLESWHYVYAEGYASVEVMAMAEKHGIPSIPGYYIEAPAMRALRVAEEARRFTVPAERRI